MGQSSTSTAPPKPASGRGVSVPTAADILEPLETVLGVARRRQLKGPPQPAISRWAFESALDETARRLGHLLASILPRDPNGPKVGCGLLYRQEFPRKGAKIFLGGNSDDRRVMPRSDRYYQFTGDVPPVWQSFTQCGFHFGYEFCFEDFSQAQKVNKHQIVHKKKEGETDRGATKSYILIPDVRVHRFKQSSRPIRLARPRRVVPARCAVRIACTGKGYASKLRHLLTGDFLRRLFRLMTDGVSAIVRSLEDDGLALADLHLDLLSCRHAEDQALQRLVFHVQTWFQDCECSVFVAYSPPQNDLNSAENPHQPPRKGRPSRRTVRLYLAATTAMTKSTTHVAFRKHYFEQGNYYQLTVRPGGQTSTRIGKQRWTIQAFLAPARPVAFARRNQSHENRQDLAPGEVEQAGSFLAFAIPNVRPGEPPYGVIRIVRESEGAFTERDVHLAAAISRSLSCWMTLFPRNEELRILWEDPHGRETFTREANRDIIGGLFGFSSDSGTAPKMTECAELEFEWLLQKLFLHSGEVRVRGRVRGGASPTDVLRITSDGGLDMIVKCASRRDDGQAAERDPIRDEVRRYKTYVEHRLPLKHNVISGELVRETRRLVGFATSFIGGGDLVSLTDYCRARRQHIDTVERTIKRAIVRFVRGVWGWWYDPARFQYLQKKKVPKAIVVAVQHDPWASSTVTRDGWVVVPSGTKVAKGGVVRGDGESFLEGALVSRDPLFDFARNGREMEKFSERTLPRLTGSNGLFTKDEIGRRVAPKDLYNKCLGKVRCVQVSWAPTVTHGDCHGDNLIVDPATGDVTVIDFGRVDLRPDIFDLALIEADLKFRQMPLLLGDDLRADAFRSAGAHRQFEDVERQLWSQGKYEMLIIPSIVDTRGKAVEGGRVLGAIARAVVEIRRLAAEVLGRRGPFEDYKLASFLLAMKYMKAISTPDIGVGLAWTSANTLLQTW